MFKILPILFFLVAADTFAVPFKCEQIKERAVRDSCIADRASRDEDLQRISNLQAQRDQKISSGKAYIVAMLNDPESARFKDMAIGLEGRVCGAVNAKNAMGGYPGFRRFVIEANGQVFFEDAGPSFPGMIAQECPNDLR